MARNEQLIRQHKVLQILERSRFGRTLDEIRDDLVDELGLSSLHHRSVRRDLEALQAAGFDIEVHDAQCGRIWKLGPRYHGTHTFSVSATELMALSLGRDLLYPLAGTPFWTGIESFWHKIQEALPAGVWKHYEKFRGVLHVLGTPAKTYEKQHGILNTVNRAIFQHRVVEIEYRSLGSPRAALRRIHPYAVAYYQFSLYIIADVCDAGDDESLRHLKLDRFTKATALDEWFTPRTDVDIERHLRSRVGIFSGKSVRTFRIWISAFAARWVLEDPWHPDQRVKTRADGSIELTVKAVHDLEIIPRVLAMGVEARVLSPASCRQAVATTARQVAEIYEQDSATR